MPEYIYPGERIEDKVIRQFSRIHQPYLADLTVTGEDGRELETVPSLPARLYDSETFSFIVRADMGDIKDTVRLVGKVGDERLKFEIKGENTGDERLLGLKWAKGRITELESQMNGTYERRNDLVRKEIIELSIKYSVLSTLTSLVAVYNRKTKIAGAPQTIVVPVAAPRGWTMPLAPDKAFAGANFCVTEACMRSYQDEEDGLSSIPYAPDESEPIEIPSFLRKGRSASNRSGLSRTMRLRAEKASYSCASEVMDSKADAGATVSKTGSITAGLHEMIITAAQLQDAAGSFGTGGDAVLRTSCFIIGMLLLEEEWKPYRIQLMKAGEALLKTLTGNDRSAADEDVSSLAAAALAMLTDKGLLRQDAKISTLESVINGLPGDAAGLFNAVLSGDTGRLPYADRSIPAANTDKKARAARYLQAVIV
jgi:hypothetical protein